MASMVDGAAAAHMRQRSLQSSAEEYADALRDAVIYRKALMVQNDELEKWIESVREEYHDGNADENLYLQSCSVVLWGKLHLRAPTTNVFDFFRSFLEQDSEALVWLLLKRINPPSENYLVLNLVSAVEKMIMTRTSGSRKRSRLETMAVAPWHFPMAYLVTYLAYKSCSGLREEPPSWKHDVIARQIELAAAFPEISAENWRAGAALFGLDLMGFTDPKIHEISLESIVNRNFIHLVNKPADLPDYIVEARCCEVLIKYTRRNPLKNFEGACRTLLLGRNFSMLLTKVSDANQSVTDHNNTSSKSSLRSRLMNPAYPILVYIDALLATRKMESAIEAASEAEDCPNFSKDDKNCAWGKIMEGLLDCGMLFVVPPSGPLDDSNPAYVAFCETRDLHCHQLYPRMGELGRGIFGHYFQCLVDKVTRMPEATEAERTFVVIASQITTMRYLMHWLKDAKMALDTQEKGWKTTIAQENTPDQTVEAILRQNCTIPDSLRTSVGSPDLASLLARSVVHAPEPMLDEKALMESSIGTDEEETRNIVLEEETKVQSPPEVVEIIDDEEPAGTTTLAPGSGKHLGDQGGETMAKDSRSMGMEERHMPYEQTVSKVKQAGMSPPLDSVGEPTKDGLPSSSFTTAVLVEGVSVNASIQKQTPAESCDDIPMEKPREDEPNRGKDGDQHRRESCDDPKSDAVEDQRMESHVKDIPAEGSVHLEELNKHASDEEMHETVILELDHPAQREETGGIDSNFKESGDAIKHMSFESMQTAECTPMEGIEAVETDREPESMAEGGAAAKHLPSDESCQEQPHGEEATATMEEALPTLPSEHHEDMGTSNQAQPADEAPITDATAVGERMQSGGFTDESIHQQHQPADSTTVEHEVVVEDSTDDEYGDDDAGGRESGENNMFVHTTKDQAAGGEAPPEGMKAAEAVDDAADEQEADASSAPEDISDEDESEFENDKERKATEGKSRSGVLHEAGMPEEEEKPHREESEDYLSDTGTPKGREVEMLEMLKADKSADEEHVGRWEIEDVAITDTASTRRGEPGAAFQDESREKGAISNVEAMQNDSRSEESEECDTDTNKQRKPNAYAAGEQTPADDQNQDEAHALGSKSLQEANETTDECVTHKQLDVDDHDGSDTAEDAVGDEGNVGVDASQVEKGYDPEDTQAYTEESVSEAAHTEDEEEERRQRQRTLSLSQNATRHIEPAIQRTETPHSDDMDAADEHTEQEEDAGADLSESEEAIDIRAAHSFSSAGNAVKNQAVSLMDFARSAQRNEYNMTQASGPARVEGGYGKGGTIRRSNDERSAIKRPGLDRASSLRVLTGESAYLEDSEEGESHALVDRVVEVQAKVASDTDSDSHEGDRASRGPDKSALRDEAARLSEPQAETDEAQTEISKTGLFEEIGAKSEDENAESDFLSDQNRENKSDIEGPQAKFVNESEGGDAATASGPKEQSSTVAKDSLDDANDEAQTEISKTGLFEEIGAKSEDENAESDFLSDQNRENKSDIEGPQAKFVNESESGDAAKASGPKEQNSTEAKDSLDDAKENSLLLGAQNMVDKGETHTEDDKISPSGDALHESESKARPDVVSDKANKTVLEDSPESLGAIETKQDENVHQRGTAEHTNVLSDIPKSEGAATSRPKDESSVEAKGSLDNAKGNDTGQYRAEGSKTSPTGDSLGESESIRGSDTALGKSTENLEALETRRSVVIDIKETADQKDVFSDIPGGRLGHPGHHGTLEIKQGEQQAKESTTIIGSTSPEIKAIHNIASSAEAATELPTIPEDRPGPGFSPLPTEHCPPETEKSPEIEKTKPVKEHAERADYVSAVSTRSTRSKTNKSSGAYSEPVGDASAASTRNTRLKTKKSSGAYSEPVDDVSATTTRSTRSKSKKSSGVYSKPVDDASAASTRNTRSKTKKSSGVYSEPVDDASAVSTRSTRSKSKKPSGVYSEPVDDASAASTRNTRSKTKKSSGAYSEPVDDASAVTTRSTRSKSKKSSGVYSEPVDDASAASTRNTRSKTKKSSGAYSESVDDASAASIRNTTSKRNRAVADGSDASTHAKRARVSATSTRSTRLETKNSSGAYSEPVDDTSAASTRSTRSKSKKSSGVYSEPVDDASAASTRNTRSKRKRAVADSPDDLTTAKRAHSYDLPKSITAHTIGIQAEGGNLGSHSVQAIHPSTNVMEHLDDTSVMTASSTTDRAMSKSKKSKLESEVLQVQESGAMKRKTRSTASAEASRSGTSSIASRPRTRASARTGDAQTPEDAKIIPAVRGISTRKLSGNKDVAAQTLEHADDISTLSNSSSKATNANKKRPTNSMSAKVDKSDEQDALTPTSATKTTMMTRNQKDSSATEALNECSALGKSDALPTEDAAVETGVTKFDYVRPGDSAEPNMTEVDDTSMVLTSSKRASQENLLTGNHEPKSTSKTKAGTRGGRSRVKRPDDDSVQSMESTGSTESTKSAIRHNPPRRARMKGVAGTSTDVPNDTQPPAGKTRSRNKSSLVPSLPAIAEDTAKKGSGDHDEEIEVKKVDAVEEKDNTNEGETRKPVVAEKGEDTSVASAASAVSSSMSKVSKPSTTSFGKEQIASRTKGRRTRKGTKPEDADKDAGASQESLLTGNHEPKSTSKTKIGTRGGRSRAKRPDDASVQSMESTGSTESTKSAIRHNPPRRARMKGVAGTNTDVSNDTQPPAGKTRSRNKSNLVPSKARGASLPAIAEGTVKKGSEDNDEEIEVKEIDAVEENDNMNEGETRKPVVAEKGEDTSVASATSAVSSSMSKASKPSATSGGKEQRAPRTRVRRTRKGTKSEDVDQDAGGGIASRLRRR